MAVMERAQTEADRVGRSDATTPGSPGVLANPIHKTDPGVSHADPGFADPVSSSELIGVAFDGVTAGLRVNADLHAPLLCVVNVFDVASGDLSLPGRVK